VTLFPAILALWIARVYVCFSDSSNMTFYIEASINKKFCFCTILEIPNVDLYHGHVRFGRSLDNMKAED